MKKLNNIHPGEILFEELMQPLNISQNKLAKAIGVSPRRINEIIHGKRSITPDTSMRLAKYFGLSDNFFFGLQNEYDMEKKAQESGFKKIIKEIPTISANESCFT